MARNVTSLEEVIREDFLQCAICTELYRAPKILPCLHSYCKQCLEPLIAEGSLRCLECGMLVVVKKGVQSLKTNVFLESLVELFQPRHLTGHECSICMILEIHMPAISRCLDCRDFLCQTCSEGHHCTRASLNHCVVDLKAYLEGQYDAEVRIRQTMYCPDHSQEPLKFFCDACNTPICRDCCFLTHRQHEVMSITDVVQKKKTEVKKLIVSLQDKISLIFEWEEGIDESLEMLKKAGEKVQEDLGNYAADVIALIQKQRDTTLGQLNAFLKQEQDALIAIKRELGRQKEKAVSSWEFSQKVMDFGKDPEILLMEDTMQKRLKEFQSFSLQERKSGIIQLNLIGKQAFSQTQFFNVNFREANSSDKRLFPSYHAHAVLEKQPSCNLITVRPHLEQFPSTGNQPENSSLLQSDESKPSVSVSGSSNSTASQLDNSQTKASQIDLKNTVPGSSNSTASQLDNSQTKESQLVPKNTVSGSSNSTASQLGNSQTKAQQLNNSQSSGCNVM